MPGRNRPAEAVEKPAGESEAPKPSAPPRETAGKGEKASGARKEASADSASGTRKSRAGEDKPDRSNTRIGSKAGSGKAGTRPRRRKEQPREREPRTAYSIFVTLAKYGLVAVSVVLLALIAIWPEFTRKEEFSLEALPDVSDALVGSLAMVNPRFEGIDENSRPFTILSDAATRSALDENSIELDRPRGEMTLANGTGVKLQSDTGVFEKEQQIVDLFGDVKLDHADGHKFRTASARFFMKTNAAVSEAPVQGESPMGSIDSSGFELKNGGQQLVFTGPATLILYQEAMAKSKSTPKEPDLRREAEDMAKQGG